MAMLVYRRVTKGKLSNVSCSRHHLLWCVRVELFTGIKGDVGCGTPCLDWFNQQVSVWVAFFGYSIHLNAKDYIIKLSITLRRSVYHIHQQKNLTQMHWFIDGLWRLGKSYQRNGRVRRILWSGKRVLVASTYETETKLRKSAGSLTKPTIFFASSVNPHKKKSIDVLFCIGCGWSLKQKSKTHKILVMPP